MNQSFRTWIGTAAIFLGLGIAFGAFGAHALKGTLDAVSTAIFEKAVFYQISQALGLFAVAAAAANGAIPPGVARRTLGLLAAGIVLFSGSLYLLAVTGIRPLGLITPFGGLSFLVAWFSLAVALLRDCPPKDVHHP